MSTYGTAAVIDVRSESARDRLVREVTDADGRAWTPSAMEWFRVALTLDDIEQTDTVADWLRAAGTARAVVAEDHDEFGARWVVLAAADGEVRVVHRRFVLAADPADAAAVETALADFDEDPRCDDVAGSEAATAAAVLFGVDPGPVVAVEAGPVTATDGVVGGPFLWLTVLGLPWPGPQLGEPATGWGPRGAE